jgi:hypothetical protein
MEKKKNHPQLHGSFSIFTETVLVTIFCTGHKRTNNGKKASWMLVNGDSGWVSSGLKASYNQ